ncbi:piggyBac transposable element-derived protein 4-like isoform X3 [Colossoma macropomum]|uniref:piggyBac transposable element-derived protein 4-like isoform X3 n=1 Tax=Colossoma macropomum TaxID=42526 RepID=UPI0018645F38|nr:piggyBac transposable element-derived protein 4-like isoform X3 [Colossoma macropomum]
MASLQEQIKAEEDHPCADVFTAVKEETESVNISGQTDKDAVKEEAETEDVKEEGENWTLDVNDEPSAVEIGMRAESPCEIEVKLEPGSESEESLDREPVPRSKGRKRAHPLQQQQPPQNRKDKRPRGGERLGFVILKDASQNFVPKRRPGVHVGRSRSWSPFDIFQLFFSTDVVGALVQNTNQNTKHIKTAHSWKELSVEEFYRFLGLVLYTGLVKAPSLPCYWSSKSLFKFEFPASVMTQARFEAIASCLHLSDPKADAINESKAGTAEYDPLHQLKPLLNDLVTSCKRYFHPFRNLTITQGEPKDDFLKFVLEEPNSEKYRLFVLADTSCSYVWNLCVMENSSASASAKGLGYDSVMQLMDIELLGQGYHLYVDSFHTSLELFKDLRQSKCYAWGIISPKALGFPRTGMNYCKVSNNVSIEWLQKDHILFLKYMEPAERAICSTIHRAAQTRGTQRKAKNCNLPSMDTGDVRMQDNVSDMLKRLTCSHRDLQKPSKWYMRLFYQLLGIACANSFILHLELARKRPHTHKAFMEHLINILVNHGKCSKNPPEPTDESEDEGKSLLAEQEGGETSPDLQDGQEKVHVIKPPSGSWYCIPLLNPAGGKACIHCYKHKRKLSITTFICQVCNAALCLTPDSNCFHEWHIKQGLAEP